MVSAEDVLEEFSGLISRKDAELIASSSASAPVRTHENNNDIIDVVGLLEFITANSGAVKQLNAGQQAGADYTVNIKDRVYRVFNQIEYNYGGRKGVKRDVVLGREGKTIRLTLFDNLSRLADTTPLERGDTVLVRNAALDVRSGVLKGVSRTVVLRMSPSQEGIGDYSLLKGGEKNIDVVGKIVEINPIRYVNRLDGGGQIGVVDCVISDLKDSMNVVLWGSSALATASMNANEFMKIEFCSVRERNGTKEVYATETSRVFTNASLEGRLKL